MKAKRGKLILGGNFFYSLRAIIEKANNHAAKNQKDVKKKKIKKVVCLEECNRVKYSR